METYARAFVRNNKAHRQSAYFSLSIVHIFFPGTTARLRARGDNLICFSAGSANCSSDIRCLSAHTCRDPCADGRCFINGIRADRRRGLDRHNLPCRRGLGHHSSASDGSRAVCSDSLSSGIYGGRASARAAEEEAETPIKWSPPI